MIPKTLNKVYDPCLLLNSYSTRYQITKQLLCYINNTLDGGGPSTVIDTRFIPRSNTNPKALFSSRSGIFEFFGLTLRNSSQSASTRFMCRSNAMKVPMKILPSIRMMRMRKFKWSCSFLFLLYVCREEYKALNTTKIIDIMIQILLQMPKGRLRTHHCSLFLRQPSRVPRDNGVRLLDKFLINKSFSFF